MNARNSTANPLTPLDVLRRRAVLQPGDAPAYGQLVAQHYGSFPVRRLRPMLRWTEALVGKRPDGVALDGILQRLENAHAVQARRLGNADRPHSVTIQGRRIRFVTDDPATHRFISANLIGQWPYEAGVVRYLLARLNADDVFVDVGAHAGYFSLIANILGAVAYAIEPQRDLIRVIERNAVLNEADRLHPLMLAVSDHEGLTCIMRLGGSPGMQMHGELNRNNPPTARNRHVDWVPTARLDGLFLDPLIRPQIVKIDVEGLEMRALAGAAGLIARQETAFIVELHPHLIAGFGGSLDALTGHFGSPEWRVIDVSSDPPLPIDLADGLARAASGTRQQDGRVTLVFEPAAWPALY